MSTQIYHITHIRNLQSVLQSGGLIANNELRKQQINHQSIAYEHIQDRRASTPVNCAARGCLHDYVPFYFAPRSPMLYTISRGNVEGYTEGQNPVLHLISVAETIAANNLVFAFTDGHAVIEYTKFYDNLQRLDMIDWNIMQTKYWSNTEEDGDRKRRRQAEFLVYQSCPWSLITEIGVINDTIKARVEQILQKFNARTPVKVYPNWYY